MRVRSAEIRVVVADDHPIVCDGVQAALATDSSVQVVATATSFQELARLLRVVAADVLLLDLSGMGGPPLPTVIALKRDYPHLAIVIFSGTVVRVRAMIKAGVLGYVAKEELRDQVLQAVHAVALGQQFLSPRAQEYFVRFKLEGKQMGLAPQEVQVLTLLAQGMSTVEIAGELVLDPRTVQHYIGVLMRKTGCSERVQLVNWYRSVFQPPEE